MAHKKEDPLLPLAEGFLMLQSELADVVSSEIEMRSGHRHSFETRIDDDSVQVLLNGDIVAELSPGGRFRIVLGEFETSLLAYEDDEQKEAIEEIAQLVVRWANGESVIERKRGVFGTSTYWVTMSGYSQQFRSRK